MLKSLLNKLVIVTYEKGYSYGSKKGVITKVNTDFLTINNDTLIATDKIIKIVIKEQKENAHK